MSGYTAQASGHGEHMLQTDIITPTPPKTPNTPYTMPELITDPRDVVGRWVAIDVETGGFDSQTDALLQLAWSTSEGDSGSIYIRGSGGMITPDALRVNRIDLDVVDRDGVSCEEAAVIFGTITRGRRIVGHNIHFDLAFILRRLYGIRPLSFEAGITHCFELADTRAMFRKLFAKEVCEHSKLADCARHLGITVDDEMLHDAAYDARLTAQVYMLLGLEATARRVREKE